jgi:hypothetical protein
MPLDFRSENYVAYVRTPSCDLPYRSFIVADTTAMLDTSLVDTQKISYQHRKQKNYEPQGASSNFKGRQCFMIAPVLLAPWLVTSFDGTYPNLIDVDYLWRKTNSSSVDELFHRRVISYQHMNQKS